MLERVVMRAGPLLCIVEIWCIIYSVPGIKSSLPVLHITDRYIVRSRQEFHTAGAETETREDELLLVHRTQFLTVSLNAQKSNTHLRLYVLVSA